MYRAIFYLLINTCPLFNATPLAAQVSVPENVSSEVFSIYKNIHQNPELGKKEYKTSKLVKDKLTEFGYTDFFTVNSLPTAVVAILDTKREGAVIALRSELDGRPGHEKTNLEYASKDSATMHSCGHDAHTSCLLGAAKLLMQHKSELKGKIIFIFQPAEETPGGADDIVNEGVLKKLGIQKMFTLHSVDGLAVGSVTIESGYFLAGSNYFTINMNGTGSHAAAPYLGNDIPVVCSKLVTELTSFPSRNTDVSMRPCVISVAYIATGDIKASNVLPDNATIKGTIRAYDPIDSAYDGQPSLRNLINSKVDRFAKDYQVTCNTTITTGSPSTYNDPDLFNTVTPKLKSIFSGNVIADNYRGLFSEDFSYYTKEVPCLYFGLGIQKDNLGNQNIHTNLFSVHPDAFKYGIELYCDLAFISNKK
ncbi:MAG: amidohydrolase [Bacteroidetes bacterium]|nr:amidohydrolase [Bacteroidota bacterium]